MKMIKISKFLMLIMQLMKFCFMS